MEAERRDGASREAGEFGKNSPAAQPCRVLDASPLVGVRVASALLDIRDNRELRRRKKARDAGAASAHRLVPRSHRPLLLVGNGQHGFDARFRENGRGNRQRGDAARVVHEAGKEAALPQVVKGREGRDPIARPKLTVLGHGSKEGRPRRRLDPALGDHAIAVRFRVIAVSVCGAFAVMHEMDTIRNERNAPALVWLYKVADRVEMREGPKRLLDSPVAGEDDWTSDAAKIRIEAKAPSVESPVRRKQPAQHGDAHGAGGS